MIKLKQPNRHIFQLEMIRTLKILQVLLMGFSKTTRCSMLCYGIYGSLVKSFQTPPGRSPSSGVLHCLLSPTISAVYRRDRRDHQTLSTILLDVDKVIAARVQHRNYTSLAFGLLSSSLNLIGLPKRLQRPLCTHHRPWNPTCLHGSSRSHCRVN